MEYHGSLNTAIMSPLFLTYHIGATVTKGQVVCRDANNYGIIGDPASVNSYANSIGVVNQAGTYSTTQGTGTSDPQAFVEVNVDPFGLWRGRLSGGTAADTAMAKALDGNILVNATAETAGTTVADTNVGTSEFVGGLLIGLNKNNAGHFRTITTHTDNTSTVVTVPFPHDIVADAEFLRIHGPNTEGVELTTNFEQFNGKPGAGADLPDTGHSEVVQVGVETREGPNYEPIARRSPVQGHGANTLLPKDITDPIVYLVVAFLDGVGNHQ